MKYITDRCCQCGHPERKEPNLGIPDTDYWFCSMECHTAALNDNIPKQYHLGNLATDDPEYKAGFSDTINCDYWDERPGEYEKQAKKWCAEWSAKQDGYISAGFQQFYKRAQAEARKQWSEQAEKDRKEQDKVSEKQRKEQEKLDEKRRILAEKQRKLDEEKEALQKEEERWQPRPFKL